MMDMITNVSANHNIFKVSVVINEMNYILLCSDDIIQYAGWDPVTLHVLTPHLRSFLFIDFKLLYDLLNEMSFVVNFWAMVILQWLNVLSDFVPNLVVNTSAS